MSRDIWTEVYRIFDPLKPLTEENLASLYTQRDGAFADWLAGSIRKTEGFFKVVISGQGGSGKSTELTKTADLLKDNYFIARLEVEQLFDIYNVNHVEILVGIATILYKRAGELGLSLSQEPLDDLVDAVNSIIKERSRETTFELSSPKLLEMVGVGGIKLGIGWETVRKEEVEPRISEIIAAEGEAIRALEELTGFQSLVFVDGLDKIGNLDMAKRIFAHSKLLSEPPCHLVYSAPFELFHSPDFRLLGQYFNLESSRELPNILIRKRKKRKITEQGKSFFQELTERRLKSVNAEGLIDSGILGKFTLMSGGVVRDFIRLVRIVAHEASERGMEEIDSACAEFAIREMRKMLTRGLTEEHMTLLEKIENDPTRLPEGTDLMKELLKNGYVLYYEDTEDAEEWYGIHPLLWGLLEER